MHTYKNILIQMNTREGKMLQSVSVYFGEDCNNVGTTGI